MVGKLNLFNENKLCIRPRNSISVIKATFCNSCDYDVCLFIRCLLIRLKSMSETRAGKSCSSFIYLLLNILASSLEQQVDMFDTA